MFLSGKKNFPSRTAQTISTTEYRMKRNPFLCFYSFLFLVAPVAHGGWKLVWSDEFSGKPLSDASWNVIDWAPGTVNQELQRYVPGHDQIGSCVWVDSGNLIIEARRAGNGYSSGRITTQNKKQWTYGRFEARAVLPAGRGTWPAIWMMPTSDNYGGWPNSGEIDIMEHVGFDPGNVHCTLHCSAYNFMKNTQKTAMLHVDNVSSKFHLYALEWYADSIKGFIDDSCYFKFKNEHTGWQTWPWDKPFHWILNVAIGGNWGGQQGVDNAIFPVRMVVDYVKVYEYDKTIPDVSAGRPQNSFPAPADFRISRSGTGLRVVAPGKKRMRASVVSLSGSIVLRASVNGDRLDLATGTLIPGVYALRIESGGAPVKTHLIAGQ